MLFCGRLIKEKGVLELIKAIKEIKNKKIKLMIVGSINFGNNQTSDYLNKLNQEINDSDNRVIATGFIKYDEIYKFYKSSDVVVIPSICNDAAPLVNIEAMACGIPTITTNKGGAPEYSSEDSIIISTDNLIENLKQNILKLYNDEQIMNKMKASGLKTVESYSTENFYNNLVNIFEKKER